MYDEYEARQKWETEQKAAQIKAVTIDLLEVWFQAMESGEAFKWYPSADCKLSIDAANKVVATIDQLCREEITRSSAYWTGQGMETMGVPIDTVPDFSRLPEPQRLALAEQLQLLFREVKDDQLQE